MGSPLRFNFTAPHLLAGLLYRALCQQPGGDSAELLGRLIENLNHRRTTLMVELSGIRADLQIADQRVAAAAAESRDAALDLELFNRDNPPAGGKRGLFGRRRLSREEQRTEAARTELEQIAEDLKQSVEQAKQATRAALTRLAAVQQELAAVERQRGECHAALEQRLAGDVLELIAAGKPAEAGDLAMRMRQLVRGSTTAGVMSVITALFGGGPMAAREAIVEAAVIFEQSPEPVVRLLENLARFAENGIAGREGLQHLRPGAFSSPGLNRLQRLVSVLTGAVPPVEPAGAEPFEAVLPALQLLVAQAVGGGADAAALSSDFAEWAAQADLATRTLAAAGLLLHDRPGLAAVATGISWEPLKARRARNAEPPPLMAQVRAIPAPAWPAALVPELQAALACIALWACSQAGPQQTADGWLAESYNFEKSNLYWWVLSRVNHDDALLRNIDPGSSEVFVPTQL